MNEEALNMSLRKFLKVVGVTSQQEIEKAIRAAVAALCFKAKLVVEPTGAAAPAAALFRAIDLRGRTAIAVVSGGNADPEVLSSCLAGAGA